MQHRNHRESCPITVQQAAITTDNLYNTYIWHLHCNTIS